jgi:lipopolysaccharide transport system permease protein
MPRNLPVTVYSPEPFLRHPFALFREMRRSLWAGRELAWRLAVRNISAMYRATVLGYVWAFLPPCFAAATFIWLRRGGLLATGDVGIPYVAWVVAGTFLWQTFADSINAPMRQVSQAKIMLAKINFPREALIEAGIIETLFNFAIRLAVLVVVGAAFGLRPTWQIIFLPPALLALVALGTMAGVLLTPAAVLYQDVEKGVPMLLPFLMILSGAVTPPPADGVGRLLIAFNPVYPLLDTCRALLVGRTPLLWVEATAVSAISVVILFAGWIVYRVSMPHLISRLSA